MKESVCMANLIFVNTTKKNIDQSNKILMRRSVQKWFEHGCLFSLTRGEKRKMKKQPDLN